MKPGDPTSFAGPPSPEDMEWRITALLLGELSPEEAAALKETIAASPALAELHQRLQHTVGVVRDAVHAPETAPADAPSALKLSAGRREKLLQAFKVIPPGRLEKERARRQPRRPVFSFREWGNVAAMAAALVVLAGGVILLQSPQGQTTKLASYAILRGDASDRGRKLSGTNYVVELFYDPTGSGSGAKPAADAAPVVPPAPPVAGPTPADGALGGNVAASEEHLLGKRLNAIVVPKDKPTQALTQLGREPAVSVANSDLGLGVTPTENKEGKPPVSAIAQAQPRQGPGQMLAWDTLSSDVDVKQKTEAFLVQGAAGDSASPRFYAGVTGGGGIGGGGGAGGGIAGGVPGGETKGQLAAATTKSEPEEKRANGLQEDKNRLSTSLKAAQDDLFAWTNSGAVAGATPPASGPAALATGGRASGQPGNAGGKDLAGNENRFGVIQNEMRIEPSTGLPLGIATNLYVVPLADPSGNTFNFVAPPILQPWPAQRAPATLADFAKQQANFGDAIADKSSGSRAAERPAESAPRPSRPAPTAPSDRKNVQDGTVRGEQELAERLADGRRGLGEIVDAESEEALNKKRQSQSTDPLGRPSADVVAESKAKLAITEAAGEQEKKAVNGPADAGVNLGNLSKQRNEGLFRDLNRNDAVEDRSGLAAPAKPVDSFAKPDATQPASEPAKVAAVRLQETDGDEARLSRAKTPAPEPQPEIQTSDNAFSTFSLNVSDVSFKLASAALEKGVRPDPGSIRTEEFINAFDYRDPEPAPGVPVGFAQERARYPFAHNRDLLRFSIKTAASGRAPGRPLNLVLLLDNSGSMERADRVQIIRACLRVLAGQLRPEDRISVVAFARTARLWVDGLPGSQANELGPRVGGLVPEGGTNLEDALRLAYQTARRHYLANGVNRVVLLTDGAANLGDVNPTSLQQQVEVQRRQGYALDCFGIGWEGYNDDLLETLARHGDGRYGFVNTPEAAATEFAAQLAGALQVAAADVKVQIEFNPQRVTLYRQIGYAKHQLTKQQFRDNTVDAAELGAAEAGNALYVVQVNPQGEGPLATVRVRFKHPTTGLFSEREWMVPYTGPAAPLEQASPALRLAATASAFSEWLAGSPFAAEVTTDRLSSLLRGVPEAYGSDPRPRKLEWMLRQAR